MNKLRQLRRLSTMKLSLAAIVFDSIFMAVYVLNETWPLEPLLYAGLRLCLTFFEHGCEIDAAERNRFRLSTPRGAQIYGTQAKMI